MNKVTFKSKKEATKFLKEKGIDASNWTEEKWQSINKSQAEIHTQLLAEAMWDAMNESIPKELNKGGWHIPFGDKMDTPFFKTEKYEDTTLTWTPLPKVDPGAEKGIEGQKIKVATARCARLSYMTHDGEINHEKDITLHDRLLKDEHMSPFEHCARAMDKNEYQTFIKGYPIIGNDTLANSVDESGNLFMNWIPTGKNEPTIHMGIQEGWCNNFRGWISYRYLVENNII